MKVNKYYTVESKMIKSTQRDINILIIKPTKNARPQINTPGILWMHGGGLLRGSNKRIFISSAINLVKKYGAIIISPDYRLSKEAPYPSALEDCYAALKYLKEHADELGINKNQIMVGGESAGGGLTATLCMYARDKKEVNIAYQMPIYPMIDCLETPSNKNNKAPIWNTKRNNRAWKKYLKNIDTNDINNISPYASPSRLEDYTNLPPAYTFVGDIEPFYDETLTYINNLKKAGVEAKVDVYKNCFHAFDMLFPYKKISKIAIKKFEEEYLYACEHYHKKQGWLKWQKMKK